MNPLLLTIFCVFLTVKIIVIINKIKEKRENDLGVTHDQNVDFRDFRAISHWTHSLLHCDYLCEECYHQKRCAKMNLNMEKYEGYFEDENF